VLALCLTPRDDATNSFPMPASPPGTVACAGAIDAGRIPLPKGGKAADATSGIEIKPAVPLADGVYGAWTQACFPFLVFAFCDEPVPTEPDFVFGIDTTEPVVSLEAPGLPPSRVASPGAAASASNAVPISLAVVHTLPEGAPLDGSLLCRIGPLGEDLNAVPDSAFFPCAEGARTFELPDGTSQLSVRLRDLAGFLVHRSVPVLVDHTVPDATIAVTANPPAGNAGWHRATPTVTVTMRDLESGWADAPVVYTTDGGAERTIPFGACTRSGAEVTCPIPAGDLDALAPGSHTIRATGVDLVGNRRTAQAMQEVTLDIDREGPTSVLATVPATPDGANGWFVTRPFSVAVARDQAEGSGVGAATISVNGEAPAPSPVPVDEGVASHVCATSVDVAGNPEPEHCVDLQVDLTDPTVAIDAPAVPSTGWFLNAPTVTVSAADGLSGIAPTFADPAGACVLPLVGTSAPSGVCVSLDGGPFRPSVGTYTIPEGVHSVRAFAVDQAGRRSAVVEQVLRVDLSAPVATARLVPPAPARAQWFRRVPTLVLAATDGEAGSGVSRIEFRVNGGLFETYTGPIEIGPGVHSIEYRAVDHARRSGPGTTLPVAVDTGMPTAKALSADPVLWLKLLGPSSARLSWTAGDDRSGTVRVTVLVVDLGGNTIRRLDGGTRTITPGSTVTGSTQWDGRNAQGTAVLGIFHYRVVVTDEAGNRSQSGESRPIQIRIL
jgi:hypothetical protein